MLPRIVFVLWLFSQVGGFILVSYGVLRESFADLAQQRGYGEGRFGEGSYGGGLNSLQERLVNLGVRLRLLSGDRTLTITDRKRNAACAIAGVLLLGISIVLDLVLRSLPDA